MTNNPFGSIEEAILAIKTGKMIILVDDENRENEGDLMMAAVHVKPADINFIAQYARGLICLTITPERQAQLQLPLMVSKNTARYGTNFTVSIEAARGVGTGISAYDRATTIQAAIHPHASADDIVMPGHVFPIVAKPNGVLSRPGHTEAGCDLARLAGLEPASVLAEILNPDGSMARRPELIEFAKQHHFKIGTVADLVQYRLTHKENSSHEHHV